MTKNLLQGEITNKSYWEQYYEYKTSDVDEIERIGSVYDKYWSVFVDEEKKSVIEIGAFPGRYLAYLADKYNLHPTGLDFQSDLTLIKKSFNALDIKDYNLINEDFLIWKPENKYDLVISIGFIEHFENYQEVISKHFEILKSDGKIFFQVPNKRYLRKLYGLIADKENLKAHNLKVMSLDIFKKAAAQNNMEIEVLEYFGPFQYGLHGKKLSTYRNIIFITFRFFFKTLHLNNLVEQFSSKFWSASIICIMKKK